jgi:hypothetical protein
MMHGDVSRPGGRRQTMIVSAVVVMALLAGGVLYFRRMEKTFADMV